MDFKENLLWLAGLQVECLCVTDPAVAQDSINEGFCNLCGGTGKVPRFPALREKCRPCEGSGQPAIIAGIHHGGCVCFLCQGRGYMPVDSMEATLEALVQEGLYLALSLLHVELDKTEKGWIALISYGTLSYPYEHYWGYGDKSATPNEALVQALIMTVKNGGKKP